MKLRTRHFGEIDVNEESVVVFPQGIPAFERLRRFAFIQPDPDVPFSYMLSVEEGDISFLLTDPFLFYPEYEFQLPPSAEEEMRIEREEDLAVWSIVTVKDKMANATLNLLAPVVVNVQTRTGRQIILHDTSYQTRHPLLRTGKGGSSC